MAVKWDVFRKIGRRICEHMWRKEFQLQIYFNSTCVFPGLYRHRRLENYIHVKCVYIFLQWPVFSALFILCAFTWAIWSGMKSLPLAYWSISNISLQAIFFLWHLCLLFHKFIAYFSLWKCLFLFSFLGFGWFFFSNQGGDRDPGDSQGKRYFTLGYTNEQT